MGKESFNPILETFKSDVGFLVITCKSVATLSHIKI